MPDPLLQRRLSPTWRKRLEFAAMIPLGPLGGDIHYERWPERSTFGKTRFDGPQTKKGRRG